MTIDPIVVATVKLSMAVLFATAVSHKLYDFAAFKQSMSGYLTALRWGEGRLVGPASTLVVMFELMIVGSCLWPAAEWLAGLLLAGVLLMYALAMTVVLIRSHLSGVPVQLDCGCSWGAGKQEIRGAYVLRNILLAIVALILFLPEGERELGLLDVLSIVFAILTAVLVYTSSNYLFALKSVIEEI